jgi:hypothetical protein
MKRFAALALLPLALAGCPAFQAGIASAPGLVNGATGAITGTLDSVDQAVDQEVLNRAARLHNLQVGLGQINSASGMVDTVPMIVTPTVPVVVAGTPLTPPPVVVAPTTPTPPVVTTPPPTTPGGPVVTPNTHRYRRSVSDIENMGELVAD